MKHEGHKASSAKVTTFKDGQPISTETKEVTMPKQEATPNGGGEKKEKAAPAPKPEKIPAESKIVRDEEFQLLKNDDGNVKHSQAKIVLEEMQAGNLTLKSIVTAIASNQELIKRMNTSQPVERCVRYHAKWLESHGYISIVKAPKPEKAPKEAKEKQKPAKTEAPSKLTHAGA